MPGDRITVFGNGSLVDKGTGRTYIEAQVQNQRRAKFTCIICLAQVMPCGIDPVDLERIGGHRFPDSSLSSNIGIMLDALADAEHCAPFRCLDAKEREKLVGYQDAFDDLADKEKILTDQVGANMTGYAFHPKAIILAVGGLQSESYEFATGMIKLDETSRLLPVPRLFAAQIISQYISYGESVTRGLSQRADSVQTKPYPQVREEDILAIDKLPPPPAFPIPCSKPVKPFSFSLLVEIRGRKVRSPPEGIRFVLPQKRSVTMLREFVGGEIEILSKRPADSAKEACKQNETFFVSPTITTSTGKAIANICKAISIAVHGGVRLQCVNIRTFMPSVSPTDCKEDLAFIKPCPIPKLRILSQLLLSPRRLHVLQPLITSTPIILLCVPCSCSITQ